MTDFKMGDVVCFDSETFSGKKKKPPEGIEPDKHYTIRRVTYCLDGAFSWDDIYFEGLSEMFCEFDFKLL